jgi:Ca2+-binding EF-hand superfamily protein
MIITCNKALLAALVVASITGSPIAVHAQQSETQTHTYSYDTNKNGMIDPDEFTTYFYSRSDTNGDGYLGDDEWKVSTSKWYRPYKDVNYNNYTFWDQDKDSKLDANEVKTLVEKTGLYSKWDTNLDKKIDNDEFAKGTFFAYDDNGDNMLSLDEWKSVLR